MQRFDFTERENVSFSEYLVVVECIGRGLIMAVKKCPHEAESLAKRITHHINYNSNDDAIINEIVKPYRIIREYDVRGNTSFITNSIWSDLYGYYEVYVVGLSQKQGGINTFIRERENYTVLLSTEYIINKYEKLRTKFKGFVFCAN